MVDYIPQDEYFEWEDILEFRQSEHFAQLKELSCDISTTHYDTIFTPTLSVLEKSEEVSICWDSGSQPSAAVTSSISTTASVSPITIPEVVNSRNLINFPSYDEEPEKSAGPELPVPQKKQTARDDSEIYLRPSRCVDYFSHEWSVEDIANSWRHVRACEKSNKNSARLENASWRSWAKMCFGLTTISPETINWTKDLDDICLYGPIKATPIDDEPVTCDGIIKPILKRPSISELLRQGSQISWTGRRHSTGTVKSRKSKVSVTFNHLVEQCFIVEAGRGLAYKSAPAVAVISSAPIATEAVWNAPEHEQNATSLIPPSSDMSQWTWLAPSEAAELGNEIGFISQQPQVAPAAYTAHPSATSIVRDTVAKSEYISEQRPLYVNREQSSSDEDEEDEMMAQFLFDCDFKSDSDFMSPSDSSSSDEDQYDEDVGFYDSADMVDEKRLMDLHEIPLMEEMKQSLYDQVLEEFNLEW